MEADDFLSFDGKKIFYYRWDASEPTAVLQIFHGMAEHSARYDDFASYLNAYGVSVYAADQRGHGKTAGNEEDSGYFADKNGWNAVIKDQQILAEIIADENPGVPVFRLGHSMGSQVLRHFLAVSEGMKSSGAVIMGSFWTERPLIGMMKFLSGLEIFFKGRRHRSRLLDNLSFGSFNKPYEPAPTAFEWLSRDSDIVKKYVDDPYCGFICTSAHFHDMAKGLAFTHSQTAIDSIPETLPVLVVSGKDDPVGGKGKSISKFFRKLQKRGINDLDMILYPDARHEILNEINCRQVYDDILGWIKKHI